MFAKTIVITEMSIKLFPIYDQMNIYYEIWEVICPYKIKERFVKFVLICHNN